MSEPFDTRLAAYCLIVRDGEILLSHWVDGSEAGRWILAGGGVEPGEPPEEAAVREVWEETGLTVDLGGLLGVHTTDIPAGRRAVSNGQRPLRAVGTVYLATVTGGQLRPEVDGSTDEARWIPLALLGGLPLGVHVRSALELAGYDVPPGP